MQHRQHTISMVFFSQKFWNVFFQTPNKNIEVSLCLSFSLSLVVFVFLERECMSVSFYSFNPSVNFFLSIRDFYSVHSFALFLCSFDAFFVIRCKVVFFPLLLLLLLSWCRSKQRMVKIKQPRNVEIESTHSKVKRTKNNFLFYFSVSSLFFALLLVGSSAFFYYVFSLVFRRWTGKHSSLVRCSA